MTRKYENYGHCGHLHRCEDDAINCLARLKNIAAELKEEREREARDKQTCLRCNAPMVYDTIKLCDDCIRAADQKRKQEEQPTPAAHCSRQIAKAFGMENLEEAGLLVVDDDDTADFFAIKTEQRTLYQEGTVKPGWVGALPEAPAAPLYTPKGKP